MRAHCTLVTLFSHLHPHLSLAPAFTLVPTPVTHRFALTHTLTHTNTCHIHTPALTLVLPPVTTILTPVSAPSTCTYTCTHLSHFTHIYTHTCHIRTHLQSHPSCLHSHPYTPTLMPIVISVTSAFTHLSHPHLHSHLPPLPTPCPSGPGGCALCPCSTGPWDSPNARAVTPALRVGASGLVLRWDTAHMAWRT